MAKKKQSIPPEDKEEKALEEKIKKMLDPREPDAPKIEVVEDALEDDGDMGLPTKIEIKEDGIKETAKATKTEEPRSAPEVNSKKIKITHHDEDEDIQVPEIKDEIEEKGLAEVDESSEPEDDVSQENAEDIEDIAALKEKDLVEDVSEDSPNDEDIEGVSSEEIEDIETSEEDSIPEKSDRSLDEAVDDIAKAESDKLLEEDDDKIAQASAEKKPSLKSRFASFFKSWWRNKPARYLTILALLLGIAAVAIIPNSRYFLLNTFGVRSAASIKIIDESTLQPLKNVTIEINGVEALTNKEGVAVLENIRLGRTNLKIQKRAFRVIEKDMTVGWGSNPLSDEQLTPVGTQYSFVVVDFVSEKPVQGVEVINGDASALSNEKGEIKLTLDMPEDVFEVQIFGDGYRVENLEINADELKTYDVQLAPEKKHVYMSRRNGTFDVYAAYADGKDEKLLLAGTGSERDDIALIPHPSRPIAALVSTRSGSRNSDGYQLSSLTVIDVENPDEPKTVIESERIQVIGWQNERLIFVQIKSGTSAVNPERHQLKTYNIEQNTTAEIANANYFNDVMLANGLLLYAPSSAYAKTPSGLFRINPDGSDKQVVHAEEVWSMFRSSYDNVTFTTGKDWFDFNIDSKYTDQLQGQPTEFKSRVYVSSPDGSNSLWVDQRDGKGTVLSYSLNESAEKTVVERGGLQLPVGWLNNTTIVFRVKTESEIADYVVNIDGGEPKKLADVTNAAGLDRWYYY